MNLLENERILLRALEPEDLEVLYRWENNPSVWYLSGTHAPYSRYVLKKYLENASRDIYELKQQRFIIALKADGRPVGAIDLFDFDPYHRRAGVGILIAEIEDRGMGYAREALDSLLNYCFEALKLQQLWCNIASWNQRSMELFQAAGFRVIGEKKDWLYNGETFDSEWLLQKIKAPGKREDGP